MGTIFARIHGSGLISASSVKLTQQQLYDKGRTHERPAPEPHSRAAGQVRGGPFACASCIRASRYLNAWRPPTTRLHGNAIFLRTFPHSLKVSLPSHCEAVLLEKPFAVDRRSRESLHRPCALMGAACVAKAAAGRRYYLSSQESCPFSARHGVSGNTLSACFHVCADPVYKKTLAAPHIPLCVRPLAEGTPSCD